ncbi:hypothetical protein [Spiroplasma endosymbiont of Dactylopius coccus]
MQKQKQEKVLLKCIVKDCNSKVLVILKTLNIEDSVVQFFNMCYFHKKQFTEQQVLNKIINNYINLSKTLNKITDNHINNH